jgi:tartronate-semialdehyde synthase
VGANGIGNKIFLESDLVLGIGCRFTDRHTGAIDTYVGSRKFIHIDIEPKQIGKIVKADIGIVSDAKAACRALIGAAKARSPKKEPSERILQIPRLRDGLTHRTKSYEGVPIKPQRVYTEMNAFFGDDVLWTTGCGNNQIWSGQFQQINKPRVYLPSGGAGTLGFDIPAAFGASIATDKSRVVAVMGDFGFTFLVEELAVAAKYETPVVVLILNNAYLSLIRQNQKYAYGYEYAVEMEENYDLIDYVKVAEGFGCSGETVRDPEDLKAAFGRAAQSRRPYVINIIVERETDASMGKTIDAVKIHD